MDYFDLYYAYLEQCEKENWANMRDPNHDYMEWNHTLPQCIFGAQPIGQWLTIEQHAIASALQTLAFGRCCLHGKHLKFLPVLLWGLAKPFYDSLSIGNLQKATPEQLLKGSTNPNSGLKSFVEGYAIFGYSKEERVEINRRGGVSSFEKRVGVFAPENLGKGAVTTNTQMWISSIDGFISTAAGVASHNRSKGGTGKDKIKLSKQ